MVLRTKPPQTLKKPRVFIVFISCECLCARRRPALFLVATPPRATRALEEPSWHVQSSGWWAVCTQTSRRRGRRMAGPTCGGFDLSSAVGVGGLTAAAGIAIRSASSLQPRVAAIVGAAAVIGLCAVARRRHRSSAGPSKRACTEPPTDPLTEGLDALEAAARSVGQHTLSRARRPSASRPQWMCCIKSALISRIWSAR